MARSKNSKQLEHVLLLDFLSSQHHYFCNLRMTRSSTCNTPCPRNTVKSYERSKAIPVVSQHAGTCLEDGLDAETGEISQEQREFAMAAFKREGEGPLLDLPSIRRALQRLDDALFQRLVESRWDEDHGSDGEGMDFESFLRLYRSVFAPAITFGRHLRKAAGRGDSVLVRELVLRGCNPNTGSGTGETALHVMAAFGQLGCAKELKTLCGMEVIMQPKDKAGWTPLMIAAGNGHTPFVRFLLDENVDPGVANKSGRTATHRAAAKGRDRVLRVLLVSKDVDVNYKDKCGYTPLHLAAMYDEMEAMRVLLEAGADTEAKDILGYTARYYCSERLWQKVVEDRSCSTRK